MKKILLISLSILVFTCSSEYSDKELEILLFKASTEINKKCPAVIDEDTRLDNTVVLSNRTVQYNYTMVNYEVENMDLKLIKEQFTPILLNQTKTNPGLKLFRDNNVTISYYYKDKNGKFILNYKATPELYK